MKTPPSKSTRPSPYPGRVQGQTTMTSGGIPNGNVDSVAVNTQQNHQMLMGDQGNQQGAIRLRNIGIGGQQGQPKFSQLTQVPAGGRQFVRCQAPSNRQEGRWQDGCQVVQGQQSGYGGLTLTIQQLKGPDKANKEKIQPVAPQVRKGQRSSSPFPCCALRAEIDSLQNSVNLLSQRLVIQDLKIMGMKAGVRTAAMALREALQEQERQEREAQGANENDDEEDEDGEVDVETIDVGYDSEHDMGEG